MYESYFGFKDTPFRLSADERFRYAHKNYLRASAYLAYALEQGEGFVMITGHPGSGKTTLIRDVISELDEASYNTLNIVTSQLHAEELLRKVALEYGFPAENANKATLLTNIQQHLSTLHEQGKRSIIFLDEAQNLSVNGLEELRLLSNLQQGKHSLLQIVLVGHDELRRLVLGPDMQHIQQRLIASCQIESLAQEQTREYIIHRLQYVDWQADPKIEEEVYQLIHLASQGIPRNINHLMSHLLLYASLEEKHQLTDEDALIVIEELIEQNRITLADEESLESFADRYRAEKEHQVMRQAVGNDSWPHQQQHNASSNQHNVSKLNTPANANVAPKKGLELDNPDSDWFLCSEGALDENDTESLPAEGFSSSNSQQLPVNEPADDAIDQTNDPEPMLPNTENVWKGSTGASAMQRSLADKPDKGRQKSTFSVESTEDHSTTRPVGAQAQEKREHSWSGVWFMSPFKSYEYQNKRTSGITDNTLPPASILNQNHTIAVNENLRMPSVWVEDCPDIVSPRSDNFHQRTHKPDKAKVLKRSLIYLLTLVSIGLMIILGATFFPHQFNLSSLAKEIQNLIPGNTTTQDALLPSHPKENQDSSLGNKAASKEISKAGKVEKPSTHPAPASDSIHIVYEETTPQSQPMNNIEVSESQEVIDVRSSGEAAHPVVDDSTIDSHHNIRLATRYFVYFDFNKSSIPKKYESLLKSIRDKMLLEDNNFLKITGYADSQGNGYYNYQLSLKRAKEVKEYFALRGIADERLQVGAVGSVNNGNTQFERLADRQRIRRVEVILFPE
ncbi:MAG: AAA family ATPase [Candidatus Thiodiazotropha sp.]|jgi:type II secretory pathway predicted ATPase ExeA/outer membrane protein OmpA-like peptidoglycan-associated protein